jgi:2-succinyl-5-enolpyruvyl-6-hydroxy-3-cyclohexene-1-carboxylate synthase
MTESWIIDQLVQQGVRHFCLAPGSRSTPLVNAASAHKKAKLHVHYDERGLGFYALGISKAMGEPAALIVTSGTAVGNLLPSIMEAHHTCTPLIVITADRPPEARDCSFNQATDQIKIFQPFVRWQIDLSCTQSEEYFRSCRAQGYFYSRQNPPGPVHINCPLRDPLYKPNLSITEGKPIALNFPRHRIERYRTDHSKGLILIGRLPQPDDVLAILELAERLRWPICADILSNARCYPTVEQIKHYDWIDKPNPEFILHFGERMTSKRILEWLKDLKCEYVHVSPWPGLQDPARKLTGRVQADIVEFCQVFEGNTDLNWLDAWDDQEPVFEETGTFTEVHAMRKISEILPPEFAVFMGNGMPIRDGDHFLFPKECRGFFGNRGLSGIDGNIATIAGLAEEMPILGIIGDQATLHDLNSIALLKKTKHPVVLLISNNFGGGIFHHLPVAEAPRFEELWAAHHDIRFEMAAKMFNIPYFVFDQLEEVLESQRPAIVELITDRKANYQYQKNVLRTRGSRTPL